jgi:signal-transduction protein with cAMP-binding, CBS, and nucleotidyltransferase domain
MNTVRKVLQAKPGFVWTIRPDATAYEALRVMADKDVGALLVQNSDGKLVGVFSERDYARKVILKGRSSKETLVSELMTDLVYYVSPDHTVNDCMAIMTAKHIRHIPVIDEGSLVGIITIGDVVNSMISEQNITIRDLENYITGGAREFDVVQTSQS